jgi:hypothetical protein
VEVFDSLLVFQKSHFKSQNFLVVTIPITLPDCVTRYRIFTLAAFDSLFGSNEKTVTTRLPLTLRVVYHHFSF